MRKAIFFDMDGVLIDSKSAWFTKFNAALNHFEKRSIEMPEFEKNVWAQAFAVTSEQYFKESQEALDKFFESKEQLFLDNCKAFEGVKELLEDLAKEYQLVVLTNAPTQLANKMLAQAGIIGFFDDIVGSEQVKNPKPAPDLLYKGLKDLNISKDEAIFVGDTVWDLEAAQAANIEFVGVQMNTPKSIEKTADLKSVL